jgi:L-threonylcarbamoyladenylate synthase
MQLSPTRATDISPEIADGLAVILDGGPCNYGIESTVVDLTGDKPKILRLGSISESQLREITDLTTEPPTERRSPGQYPRHYAPKSPVHLKAQLNPNDAGLTFDAPSNQTQIQMPNDPVGYAALLYSALHDLDRLSPDAIIIQTPPQMPEWSPIWDRLLRAIHPNTL